MSTMMTFEYLSQLCQNKDRVFSLPTETKDSKGEGCYNFGRTVLLDCKRRLLSSCCCYPESLWVGIIFATEPTEISTSV